MLQRFGNRLKLYFFKKKIYVLIRYINIKNNFFKKYYLIYFQIKYILNYNQNILKQFILNINMDLIFLFMLILKLLKLKTTLNNYFKE